MYDDNSQLVEHFDDQWRGKARAELDTRREQCIARAAELGGYKHPSQAQRDEFDSLTAETIVIDNLIKADDVEIRRAKIEHLTRVAADPANLERPVGAPPLVKGLGDRRETGAEVIQRAGNPWRHQDGGPLHRAETGAGLISRAHSALEGLEDTLTRDGCQKLADAMAEESTWPGVMIKRSKEEQAQAAELWLALSNPFYAEAFRSVLRYPGEFMGSGGTGFETLSDDQRQAWRDVRTNELCRAAFGEATRRRRRLRDPA